MGQISDLMFTIDLCWFKRWIWYCCTEGNG